MELTHKKYKKPKLAILTKKRHKKNQSQKIKSQKIKSQKIKSIYKKLYKKSKGDNIIQKGGENDIYNMMDVNTEIDRYKYTQKGGFFFGMWNNKRKFNKFVSQYNKNYKGIMKEMKVVETSANIFKDYATKNAEAATNYLTNHRALVIIPLLLKEYNTPKDKSKIQAIDNLSKITKIKEKALMMEMKQMGVSLRR